MADILERIDAAIERITSGHAPMRVPAEETDPDLVLSDCRAHISELRTALFRERAAVPPVGERERKLAERVVEDWPPPCVCGHPESEHHHGKCMHGFDGHTWDCGEDCKEFRLDPEYRDPPIVAEARAILSSPAPDPASEPRAKP